MVDSVKDIDRGFKRIQRELKRMGNMQIFVGFQGASGLESGPDSDATIVDIATFHEFGTVNIPERPFLRSAMDVNKAKIGSQFETEIKRVIDGKQDALQAANRLGIFGVELVRERIRSSPSWAEALDQSTIDLKGSSVPLIDTGQLVQSVTYLVREGGATVAEGGA